MPGRSRTRAQKSAFFDVDEDVDVGGNKQRARRSSRRRQQCLKKKKKKKKKRRDELAKNACSFPACRMQDSKTNV
jgi:hypothetical protein